ncbi:MAG: hypothetical protein ACRC1D_08260, partial [Culicoidibacterales bacterium]
MINFNKKQAEVVIEEISPLYITQFYGFEGELGSWLSISNVSVYEESKVYCKFCDKTADKIWKQYGGRRGSTIITEFYDGCAEKAY